MSALPADAQPQRRRRARRGEGERLRDEILDAFDALLTQTNNVDAISVRAIANAIGITAPALYLHFPTKDDLVFAACNRHFKSFQDALEGADDTALAPMERLARIGRAYCEWGIANPEAYRIMFMDREVGPPDDMPLDEIYGLAALTSLISIIETGIAANAFTSTDAIGIAMTLWAAVHGVTALAIAQHSGTLREHMPRYDSNVAIDQMLMTLARGLQA
jgi:AcrR family transcriptional regulator